jgi:hypothetical protein
MLAHKVNFANTRIEQRMQAGAPTPFITMKTRRATETANRPPVLFHIKPEPAAAAAAINYFRTIQIHDAALHTEPDGLYTWILKRMDDEGTLLLVAGRTRSAQEIGTLHQNLYEYSPLGANRTPDDVFAAGEFMKIGNRLLFNIQSGSFMGRRFDQLRSAICKEIKKGKAPAGADAAAIEELKSKILATVYSQLAHLGFEPVFAAATVEPEPDIQIAGKPMINTAPIVTEKGNYERYLEFADPTPYVPPEPKSSKGKKK